MLVVISYDINTEDADGKRRLRKVAKECVNYGQRVQSSVFECFVDFTQFTLLKHKLCKFKNNEKDSIRFYKLGNNYKNRIESFGIKTSYSPDEFLSV